jgi:uncharacterized membrane protein YphA (DoxX/SURF4 family)
MHHTKREEAMRKYQKGEVMLVVMVVMMGAVWLVSGHMGMMGHGEHSEKQAETAQPIRNELSSPPPASPEQQH